MPDADAVIFDKLTYAGNLKSIEGLDHVGLVVGDITDPDTINPPVRNTDAVVNFAAKSYSGNSLNDPSLLTHTNVEGTSRLLEVVHRRRTRFYHISADEAYDGLEIGELRRFVLGGSYTPSSPCSSSKGASDLLVRAWVRSFGAPVTISNCSDNHGPYQHVEEFTPRTITNVIDRIRPRIYGTGEQMHGWIYVRDHSTTVQEIIDKGHIDETYLIGTDDERNNPEVIQTILTEFGRKPDGFDHVSDRPGHDQHYVIDNSKLIEEAGWNPSFADFTAGLHDTIKQYKASEDWWCPQKDGVEAKCAKTGR